MFIKRGNIKDTNGSGNNRRESAFFQPKLAINQPGDVFEREADVMADKVMPMTDAPVNQHAFFKPAWGKPLNHVAQRKCQACEEEQKHVHRKEVSGKETQSPANLDSYVGTLQSSGRPLPDSSRSFFEPRFGRDFSNVRIHTDDAAAKSAQSINALAYTTGNNIVFNNGHYSPESDSGKKLIAHELTHVVQQNSNSVAPKIQRHKDDIVAYSGGQSGKVSVIQAGKLVFSAPAVSGHEGNGENVPDAGPIPTANYMMHPGITQHTVTKLEDGICGAGGIGAGYQEITSKDPSPCTGAHYCNVPCPTDTDKDRKCFTPVDCWGPKRIRIQGSVTLTGTDGNKVTRDGFYLHGGNPADAVSSGCVKSLDNNVFDPVRKLTGYNDSGAVPFCVGTACPPLVSKALATAAPPPAQQSPAPVQPKLTVNQPNDAYEQEADQVADKVMRIADVPVNQNAFFKPVAGPVQRKCQACEEEDKFVHRKENNEDRVLGGSELESYVASLHSSGQPMPESSREFFEPRFGRDFSDVKFHTDAAAAKSAQSINALAYTAGNNIVFNTGQYSPESDSGKRLMAHELTHVVQQGKNVVARNTVQRTPGVDAADSFKDMITVSMDGSVTTDAGDKTTRSNEAIKRMMSTRRGAALINRLWGQACKGKPACGKINIIFTDALASQCPASEAAVSGCFRPSSANSFPYTVVVGNVLPTVTRGRTLFSQWGTGDNKVIWHHTDPESAMANTLFHELLHIFFVNSPNHDPLMPTGHLDPNKGEIDPNFSRFLQDYNNQLDVKEQEAHGNP